MLHAYSCANILYVRTNRGERRGEEGIGEGGKISFKARNGEKCISARLKYLILKVSFTFFKINLTELPNEILREIKISHFEVFCLNKL